MGNYIELLNYLLERKKVKKDSNEEERKKYTDAMIEMLKSEGYSASERYLYDGFVYCKAIPLKTYIESGDDSSVRIHEFFNGEMYTKNCGITSSILFNLLALYLNEEKLNVKIVNLIIKKIPAAIFNKEGKMFGKAHWALNSHFIRQIKGNDLPPMNILIENGLSRKDAEDFCFKIALIISRLEKEILSKKDKVKLSKKNFEKLQKVKAWIKKQPSDEDLNKKEIINNITIENVEIKSQKSYAEIELEKKKKELLEVKEQLNKAAIIKDSQRDTIKNMQAKMNSLNENIVRLDETLKERNSKIFELTSMCKSQVKEIEELELKISQKNIELNERSQMMEALSRDREKQSDESLNRLASKLRVEYRDFLDAVDIPMDSDLGENMREQLRNVFDILIKSGISIND